MDVAKHRLQWCLLFCFLNGFNNLTNLKTRNHAQACRFSFT